MKIWILLIMGYVAALHAASLQQMEYYWDTDPGEGSGVALTAEDGSFDQAFETSLADPANQPSDTGAHTLCVRAQNASGTWGPVMKYPVYVQSDAAFVVPDVHIASMRYYCGNSGYVAFPSVTEDVVTGATASVTVPGSLAKRGPQACGVQAQNTDGSWSDTLKFSFFGVTDDVPYAAEISGDTLLCTDGTLHAYTEATYSVPSEYGATFTWMVTGGTVVSTGDTNATISWDTTASEHIVQVYGTNSYGTGDTTSFSDVRFTHMPGLSITADGNLLGVPDSAAWTYSWTLQGELISDATDRYYWATESGNYRAIVGTFCGNDTTAKVSVTYDADQVKPGTDFAIVEDSGSVAENDTGAVIDTLETSGDEGYTVTWSLLDDQDAYQIDATTGVLSLQEGVALDYETMTRDTLQIQATLVIMDTTVTYAYVLQVSNVNEAPELSGDTFAVSENQAAGEIGTLEAEDPDGDVLEWSVVSGNDEGLFGLDADGILSTTGALDYESDSLYTLTVQVSDGELSQTAVVVVQVVDLDDESPTFSGSSVEGGLGIRLVERQILFQLPSTGQYVLELFDAQGALLARQSGPGGVGEHLWRIPQGLQGVGFVRLRQGGLSYQKLLCLLQGS